MVPRRDEDPLPRQPLRARQGEDRTRDHEAGRLSTQLHLAQEPRGSPARLGIGSLSRPRVRRGPASCRQATFPHTRARRGCLTRTRAFELGPSRSRALVQRPTSWTLSQGRGDGCRARVHVQLGVRVSRCLRTVSGEIPSTDATSPLVMPSATCTRISRWRGASLPPWLAFGVRRAATRKACWRWGSSRVRVALRPT